MGEWGWAWAWFFTAAPLVALAVWHCTDAFYWDAFLLKPSHRGRRLPPGHMGIPLLGETPRLMWYFKVARRPDSFIEAKRRAYGGREGASIVGLTSLSNVEGKQHTRLRGCIIAAVNQPGPFWAFAQVVQPRVEAVMRSWADKGIIVAATEIRKVMFENICKTFISLDPSPLTDKMEKFFKGLIDGLMAFPLNFPGTACHHGLMCRRKLNALFREELERRMKKKNKEATAPKEEEDGDDLMSRLMETEDEQGNKLSDDEVVDIIGSLVIGAYDSTATATLWAAYHLAKSPDILARLRDETAALTRAKNNAAGACSYITYDDISKLKYTAKVAEEAIRVANFAPMIHRVALKDVEYEGYTIPKGWRVVVRLRSVHTDPMYFKDPLTFDPDRWDEPAKPGTYRAFGGGYRTCAGSMLARLQITIMLYHLSLGYEWKLLNPDARIVYFPICRPEDNAAMAFARLGTGSR
ncbi:hypothetical protein BRADI_4g09019v3 [Brachypodium distachyon]|uniref:Uncharacterized protein n=1 Tax=Brachypodium distachyon TaxID=15368 RepID=A0A0Q3IL80_BRADI|nr:hypothetical protein BRADI_4g09019v3 [Brachypodium distachyon]